MTHHFLAQVLAFFVGKTCQRLNMVEPGEDIMRYITVFLAHTHTHSSQCSMFEYTPQFLLDNKLFENCEAILVSKPCVYVVFNGLADLTSAVGAGYHLILLLAHIELLIQTKCHL